MSAPQRPVIASVLEFAKSKVAAATCPKCKHLIASCEKTLEGAHVCPPESAAEKALIEAACMIPTECLTEV